jgi:hypothetical protein
MANGMEMLNYLPIHVFLGFVYRIVFHGRV